jgi:hypothetical protein
LRSGIAELRRLHPRTAILLAVCALIVALGPPVLTLARKSEYQASTSIAQRVDDPESTRKEKVVGVILIVGANVGSRDALRAVADELPWLDSRRELLDHVEVSGRWRDGPEVLVTARAPSSKDARTLAGGVSQVLSEKAELPVRIGDEFIRAPRGGDRAFDPPTPVRGEEERPVDAVLGALPGRFPPRAQPGWAAAAGASLAVALIVAVAALGPWSCQRPQDRAV